MIRVLRPEVVPPSHVATFLDARHYLGAARRGIAWSDRFGVMVWAAPTSRYLPSATWLELVRWCLLGERNGGSQQFRAARRWLFEAFPEVTTLVSYSDPSQGHTGALYKACSWRWAPTWHRLFPPPSGNGDWGSGPQGVKDRWIYELRPDTSRISILSIKDSRATDWAESTGRGSEAKTKTRLRWERDDWQGDGPRASHGSDPTAHHHNVAG